MKTRVVLSGIYYPMAILRYFENAFRRRPDVELITVGPYTGNYIPWKGGMYTDQKYAKKPDFEIPNVKSIPFAGVERMVGIDNFDLWIQIDADFHLDGFPSKGVHFIVATDPHAVDYNYQRRTADKFFCMQKSYSRDGDVYLPYAYDPDWHRPPVEGTPKVYDVACLGLMYAQRVNVMDELRKRGRNVYLDTGPIFKEALDIYHKTKVGFNWSSLDDLNARVFEMLAMGLPCVMNRVSDMDLFFQDKHDMLIFDTKAQAVDMIESLLDDLKMAANLARNGLESVKPHTWDARVDQIMQEYYNA